MKKSIQVDDILAMLSWDSDSNTQQTGIKIGKKIGNISWFIQPLTVKYNKNVWGNCAIIVANADNKTLEPCLLKLFEWLQDTNWPGAMTIYNRLLLVPREMLMIPYNKALQESQNVHDELWEEILVDFMKDYESKHKV